MIVKWLCATFCSGCFEIRWDRFLSFTALLLVRLWERLVWTWPARFISFIFILGFICLSFSFHFGLCSPRPPVLLHTERSGSPARPPARCSPPTLSSLKLYVPLQNSGKFQVFFLLYLKKGLGLFLSFHPFSNLYFIFIKDWGRWQKLCDRPPGCVF